MQGFWTAVHFTMKVSKINNRNGIHVTCVGDTLTKLASLAVLFAPLFRNNNYPTRNKNVWTFKGAPTDFRCNTTRSIDLV